MVMRTRPNIYRLNALERAVFVAGTNQSEPRLAVPSQTRIDTGRWWRRTRLWVCVTDRDMVVLAAGRRRYIERFPIAECRASHYCHTTGELVIQADKGPRFNHLAMSPVDGLAVLHAIGAVNAEETQGIPK